MKNKDETRSTRTPKPFTNFSGYFLAMTTFAILSGETILSQEPVFMGRLGSGYKVGALTETETFESRKSFEERWHVQQLARSNRLPSCEVKGDGLHVFSTSGTTIWFKKRLHAPVIITYKVKMNMPLMDQEALISWRAGEKTHGDAILPSDVNCFWMADFPASTLSIFDDGLFNGNFGSYHKQSSYYASVGGRANSTTRARRYPRVDAGGRDVLHPVWIDHDGKPGYGITPEKTQQIQLVAVDGIVQHLLDGTLVYEFAFDQTVKMTPDNDRTFREGEYTEKKFPFYKSGYFGFRLVRSAHIYSDFRVYSVLRT